MSDRRQVTYDLVYEIRVGLTGVSSLPDITHVHTPEEAGAVVAAKLREISCWQQVTVCEREVRA